MMTSNINPYAKRLFKKSSPYPTILAWVNDLKKGNPNALARAITLIESTNAADKTKAKKLLSACKIDQSKSIRLGITGAPGVGKSSFIESFGLALLQDNSLRIAVLTYDPISPLKGGSILGDKTRMQNLSNHIRAFIRPSPSTLSSSINDATRSSIELCEVAGFDFIIVETVGVGQSELNINHLVDYSILLLSPTGGDELQGIKRGIIEIADLIVVNKDDSGLENAAKTTQANYQNAIKLLAKDQVRVMKCSSINNKGIEEVKLHLLQTIKKNKKEGVIFRKRKNQRINIFKEIINQKINYKLTNMLMNKKSNSFLTNAKAAGTDLDDLAEKFIKTSLSLFSAHH